MSGAAPAAALPAPAAALPAPATGPVRAVGLTSEWSEPRFVFVSPGGTVRALNARDMRTEDGLWRLFEGNQDWLRAHFPRTTRVAVIGGGHKDVRHGVDAEAAGQYMMTCCVAAERSEAEAEAARIAGRRRLSRWFARFWPLFGVLEQWFPGIAR